VPAAEELSWPDPTKSATAILLRLLAASSTIDADGLVESLREVERLHSMGHITSAQLAAARHAYAATIEREPRQGAARSAESRAEERG
jgi:hypothetical protein